MDKEDVVCIYIYIKCNLLSHKKDQIWVNCSEVDEPRTCYTEWRRSEREKQILNINAYGTSLVAQMVKHLSTMRETWVQSLGWEDLLEKEMAIHSSTIAWKIPWTEEPGRLQPMGSQRVGHDWVTSLHYLVPDLRGNAFSFSPLR